MNQLAQLRENAKHTQIQVVQAIDVDRSAMAKWETGVALPRAEKLPHLAALYNCSIEAPQCGHWVNVRAPHSGQYADVRSGLPFTSRHMM